LGAATTTPAPGQTKLPALRCASAAFNDVKIRAGVPLAYRTTLNPSETPGTYPIVISLEPAHKASLLAQAEELDPGLVDDFILRTEYLAEGHWDGESIKLASDNFSMSLGRFPGKQTLFYNGSIAISNAHGVEMSCWSTPIQMDYAYNTASGLCEDQYGEEGQNRWTLQFVRDNQNGECTDLGHAKINEEDYSYPNFKWNLKGANLSNIDMVFSNFVESQFEGANLDGMTLGYASIKGSLDAYTRLPEEGCERLSDTSFECSQ
jgi:hypothetical protein